MGKNVGFVSFRFAGTDGVSLEAAKWAALLDRHGHESLWFAGEVDRHPERCFLVPEAHFTHPDVIEVQDSIFGTTRRPTAITAKIHTLRELLKGKLHDFIDRFAIDVLVAQNHLAIPMNVPLSLATAEVIAETGIPTVAHHHDFYWERTRFCVNCVQDYLAWAFPPRLASVRHAVINTPAQEGLALRAGVPSIVVPNVLDFRNVPETKDTYTEGMRADLGFAKNDIIFLQPTRVVPRKGIEHAIEVVSRLKDPRIKLVISHAAGDEGLGYATWLTEQAERSGVDLRMIAHRVGEHRGSTEDGKKIYTLWDVYPIADFVTYPSLYEGWGNALLEAMLFKKPILVNRYSIYQKDIEPLGFHCVPIDGFVTEEAVAQVRTLLSNADAREAMVEKNFILGKRHFSYEVLGEKLAQLFGTEFSL